MSLANETMVSDNPVVWNPFDHLWVLSFQLILIVGLNLWCKYVKDSNLGDNQPIQVHDPTLANFDRSLGATETIPKNNKIPEISERESIETKPIERKTLETKPTSKTLVNAKHNLSKKDKKRLKRERQEKRGHDQEAKRIEANTPLLERLVTRTRLVPQYIHQKITNSSHSWCPVSFTTKECTSDLIDKSLQELNHHLLQKNVNVKIVEVLINACRARLLGGVIKSWQRFSTLVRQTMMEEIQSRCEKQKENLIGEFYDSIANRVGGNPYQILLVGANGVGKSTTLAKLIVWLEAQNEKNLLDCHIVAADTFRAGAVEQLRTHSKALGVRLHEAGGSGEGEASKVVNTALVHLRSSSSSSVAAPIVLVDSAGRMYSNKKLMNDLKQLVRRTLPQKVLFVVETIAGHDAIAQVKEFQAAVEDARGGQGIDGLILTKFDMVGSQIGGVLNLVVESQLPILFVGIGQQYEDLRALPLTEILDLLMTSG